MDKKQATAQLRHFLLHSVLHRRKDYRKDALERFADEQTEQLEELREALATYLLGHEDRIAFNYTTTGT